MLYYDRIDISDGVDPTKVIEVMNEFATITIGVLIMDSNFKILYAMVVMI